ncbi:hypothetical protein MPRM_02120 [Mycobacterium parmense]|uniref:Uncharacterized protein n=1 Tax=Mycobacterium parmense TaxID=185642 RepID=A0A7I7YQ95_9MYCO|nr:hypothetical protein MPRM_02120 [Mycobacterium parmense]
MMVGLAIATMVESTMIMKKPIIIAHSAFHGFCECGEFPARKPRSLPTRGEADPAGRVSPADRGIAVVNFPPRFHSRRRRPARNAPAWTVRGSGRQRRPDCIITGEANRRAADDPPGGALA